jgi:hypothetical protein
MSTWRIKCVCGQPATTCVVVHWKTKDCHYDYCDLHAALVAEMQGVDLLGPIPPPPADMRPYCILGPDD